MPEAKPYDIPKQLVWDAYQRVKANRGAAGVDGESLAAFEKDLKGNLYKIWNRMSSGSYFPPPVRLVEIPKKGSGGKRPLGIPTVGDRVAQTVVTMVLQPLSGDFLAKYVFRTQPVKFAAMEGQFRTQARAPLRIGGWPDSAAGQTRWAIEIPGGLPQQHHRVGAPRPPCLRSLIELACGQIAGHSSKH